MANLKPLKSLTSVRSVNFSVLAGAVTVFLADAVGADSNEKIAGLQVILVFLFEFLVLIGVPLFRRYVRWADRG